MKKCYIVSVLGYWGRGKTVKEAALQCAKEGGRRKDKSIIWLIIGDDKASIDSSGRISYDTLADFELNPSSIQGNDEIISECLMVTKFLPLGSLMNLVE